jgi:hypothetical protein
MAKCRDCVNCDINDEGQYYCSEAEHQWYSQPEGARSEHGEAGIVMTEEQAYAEGADACKFYMPHREWKAKNPLSEVF